jgi:ribosomal protein S18 acetylase RimI-like enzyme
MDWHIRSAITDDADRLSLVGAATFLATFAGILDGQAIVDHCARAHSAHAYRDYLLNGASAWLGEVSDGAPVGFALLGGTDLPGSNNDGSDVELNRIYILSRFHDSGLGNALMQAAADEAVRRGAARLMLGVYAGNARAQAFYRKQGFVEIARRLFRVGGREYDDIVFARPLR